MKNHKDFKPNRSCWNQTSELSFSSLILSILQYSKKCHTFYKIVLPVYLRDHLSKKVIPNLMPGLKGIFSINLSCNILWTEVLACFHRPTFEFDKTNPV